MHRKLFVSRQSLACCPQCCRHVRFDRSQPAAARCDFCGAAMVDAPPVEAPRRGGVLGRALLGTTVLLAATSCFIAEYGAPPDSDTSFMDATGDADDEDSTAPDGDSDTAVADTRSPDGGDDPDARIEDALEVTPEPEYGIPPDPEP